MAVGVLFHLMPLFVISYIAQQTIFNSYVVCKALGLKECYHVVGCLVMSMQDLDE